MCQNPSRPCVLRPLSPHLYPGIEWDGPALTRKAASRPSERRVWFDRRFYGSLSPAARLGFFAHEVGHLEGAECEPCADRRGGQLLAEWGVLDGGPAASAFLHRIEHRDNEAAARNVAQGFGGIPGEQSADAGSCPGSLDGAGLCKVGEPSKVGVLSFRSGETPAQRVAKAAARGLDGSPPHLRRSDCPPLTHCSEPTGIRFRGRSLGADSSTLATELASVPSLRQTFATTAGPTDPLSQILADAAVEYGGDDARRFAWMLASILDGEAGRLGPHGSGGYDPASVNTNPGGSSDLGIMQINNGATATHRAFAAKLLPDGSPAWKDARESVRQGAYFLAQNRTAFPGNIKAQFAAYNAGPNAVGKVLAAGRDPDLYPGGSGHYAADKLATLSRWGAPDVQDDRVWSEDPLSSALSSLGLPSPSFQTSESDGKTSLLPWVLGALALALLLWYVVQKES